MASSNQPVVIVTGASSGIGKEISIQLAKHNFNLILIARSKNKLLNIKKEIEQIGAKCQIIALDISSETMIQDLKSKIKNLENVQILINNAGIGIFDKIEDVTFEDWEKQINTNLRGSFLLSQFIIPNFKRNKCGKIVFMNSVAGLSPYPFAVPYVASKYALRGLSASLREELREYNIKVISVHPGAVDTPLWEKSGSDFPRNEMMSSYDIAKITIEAILAPNNIVCEEIILRRTAGDFK